MDDYEKAFPGRVDGIREWFRIYKTLDGKPENKFTEDGRVYTRDETIQIVESTINQYGQLIDPKSDIPQRKDFWLKRWNDKN